MSSTRSRHTNANNKPSLLKCSNRPSHQITSRQAQTRHISSNNLLHPRPIHRVSHLRSSTRNRRPNHQHSLSNQHQLHLIRTKQFIITKHQQLTSRHRHNRLLIRPSFPKRLRRAIQPSHHRLHTIQHHQHVIRHEDNIRQAHTRHQLTNTLNNNRHSLPIPQHRSRHPSRTRRQPNPHTHLTNLSRRIRKRSIHRRIFHFILKQRSRIRLANKFHFSFHHHASINSRASQTITTSWLAASHNLQQHRARIYTPRNISSLCRNQF